MNGYTHKRRVRYHFSPPQKLAVTAFDRNRAFIIGIALLFSVFALVSNSFFSSNLIGYVTAPSTIDAKYVVDISPAVDGKNIVIKINSDTQKVNGVYFELFSPDQGFDLCKSLGNDPKKVENKLWNSGFADVKCNSGRIMFGDATLDGLKAQSGTFEVAQFPILGNFLAAKKFNLELKPLKVYGLEKGNDLFGAGDYKFYISLEEGVCGDGVCNKGEDSKTCAKDCGEIVVQAVCGNGKCESSETTANCEKDCPADKGPAGSSSSSSGGGSSKGGSGPGCVPQWDCGNWGLCNNTNQQSRVCNDVGKQCKKPNVKTEVQACAPCPESWICSAWNDCTNGEQMRSCQDERKCGTVASKPVESKGCNEVVPAYVPPQQTYQPPPQQYQPPVAAPVVQKPQEVSFWDEYKSWILGIPMGLLFVVILVLSVLHFTNRGQQITYNYDELKDWMKKERTAGTSDDDIRLILAQNTGWTKEEVEKMFASLAVQGPSTGDGKAS